MLSCVFLRFRHMWLKGGLDLGSGDIVNFLYVRDLEIDTMVGDFAIRLREQQEYICPVFGAPTAVR